MNVLTSGIPQLVFTSESVASSVGSYHNSALEYLRTHGLGMDGATRYTSDNVNQTITGIGDYLKSAGIDPTTTDAATATALQNISQANLIYTDKGVKYFGAPVTTDQFVPYMMGQLQSSGAVSAAFVTKVNSVNTMIVNRADSAAVLEYVNNSFLGSFATPEDNHAAEVFVDIYRSSYAYWNDPAHQGGSGGPSYAMKPGDGVIIADALGGLHGLLLGPVVSIIEGAVCSIIANHSSMAAPSGNGGIGGLNHTGLGTASLDAQLSRLVVSNIGSSGQDGVEIQLPSTSAWEGHWLPLDTNNTLPVGAYIQSQAFGNAGPISNGLLGSWRATKQDTNRYAVTADYSPLGSATVTVQIYNGTTLVATRTGLSGQLGIINGCVEDDHHGNPIPTGPFHRFGGALTMFGPTDIQLPDGMIVTGDRFAILPEGAADVSTLTRVNVQTSGVPQLAITNESVLPSVGSYHNSALDYLSAHGLLINTGTRITSDNLTVITNGIADYLKSSGFDPSETDAAATTVLSGFSQANLLYASGGVTYFGAPVTTDQYVPYIMAFLQNRGSVSTEFVAKVNAVNAMIVNRTEPATVMAYVASSFVGTFQNAADNRAAAVFVDTFTNSYAYWMDPAHQGATGTSSKPAGNIILADATGAVFGLLLGGPGGAIIGGVGLSTLAKLAMEVVPQGTYGFGGLNHIALGNAGFDVQYKDLTVANLGSSGQDGVEIRLPYTSAWEGHWLPLDTNNTLPVGAYIQSQAFGNAGSISNGLLGTWRATKQDTNRYAVTADYSPLGSATVTVQIYNGTTLVATRTGQSGQLGIINGCVEDDHHGNPIPTGPFHHFGGALTMFGPLDIQLSDGMIVAGDRFAILPEGATDVSSLTRVNVQTSGVPQLAITNESVVSSVGTYHNSALDYLSAHGLLVNGASRFTSANVTVTTNGIADYLKSAGFDSSATDATAAAVLQNLSQANLLYTAGGVTYFGAPVTSDQYVPYLMTLLQNRGTVSAQFVAKVNIINTMIVNRTDSAAVMDYVANSFIGTFANPADNQAAEIFVDTFTKSYAYWTDAAHQGGPIDPIPSACNVVEADAAGALFGWAIGGMGDAIVYSAVFSAIAKYACDVVPVGNTGFDGLNHVVLGTAGLDVQYKNLTVSNLGSSGQDGVEIALPYTSGWEGHWQPLDTNNTLPIGAYVQSQVFGNAGQISNGLLGSWRLTKQDTGHYAVTADYSPLGSTTVTVQVYDGTTLKATRTGQSGQLGIINGCVRDDHHGNPIPGGPFGPFGSALTFFGPQDPGPLLLMTLADGTTVTGDRFVILPEGTTDVNSLTRVNVQTSGVPQLALTNEAILPSVGTYHNSALDYLYAHGTWTNAIKRFNTTNLTEATSEVAAYLKSEGCDPAATDAATAKVLQNLGKANLLYGDAGTTYFGAPVTTDQFIPYLMAHLQDSGVVSAAFVAKVNIVNTMVVNRADSAVILDYVEHSFIGTFATPADNHAAEVFVDTYKASYAYWTNPVHQGGSGGASFALKDGDKVIIADAAGALSGLILGPIASIIEGAVVSLIANHASMVVPSGNHGFGGLDHTGIGTATLDIQHNRLIVSNLGSSGQDGVTIPMPKSASWMAHWQPLDPTGSLPAGAYVQSEILGTAGSITNGPLGSWRLTKLPSGSYGVTANFTPLGASTVTLQVFNGTTLVTTLTGQSGALVIVNGCVDDDHWGNPTPTGPYGLPTKFGGALTLNDPRTFTFAGGTTAVGDRLVILPEGGATVSSLSQTKLLTSGITEVAIDTELNSVQASGYADWAATTAAAAGITPAQLGGPQDDYDHDGFSNLLEYAFGTDAAGSSNKPVITSGVANLQVGDTTSPYFTMSCVHPADRVAPVAEASDDLQTWTPAVLVSSVLQADGQLLDTWRTPQPTTAKSHVMMRFQVTSND